MQSIRFYIKKPKVLLLSILQHLGGWIPDKLYLKWLFRLKMGKRLDLKKTSSFNEKLQWLKLYDRKPEYTTMVDKYAVKEYVANVIGEEYIIPTLGIWKRPEDIDWDTLPDQFVLKTTHGGGNTGVVICRDKASFDCKQAIGKLKESLHQNIYRSLREWPYKDVPRRIMAEQYIMLSSFNNDLPDYKFFCFDGDVKALFVATERSSGEVKFDYFDADFNHLDLFQTHPMSGRLIMKPKGFDEMKTIASNLSKGLPHVRVDLYNLDGKIYFGELTFYHHGGLVPFHPDKWDYEFGSWIKLPMK